MCGYIVCGMWLSVVFMLFGFMLVVCILISIWLLVGMGGVMFWICVLSDLMLVVGLLKWMLCMMIFVNDGGCLVWWVGVCGG